jgi:hypothetical protein
MHEEFRVMNDECQSGWRHRMSRPTMQWPCLTADEWRMSQRQYTCTPTVLPAGTIDGAVR